MDKALAIYAAVLKACLGKDDTLSPEETNTKRFTVRALFIAAVLYKQHNADAIFTDLMLSTDSWLKTTFAQENRFSDIIGNTNRELIAIINTHMSTWVPDPTIITATLYETLLGIETGEEQQADKLVAVKYYRNKLGSYYTPAELASQVTVMTISHFLKLNKPDDQKVLELTFADFSCGAGNFLLEIIHFFEKWAVSKGMSAAKTVAFLKQIARNIHATDVDCIALEVAKLTILLKTDQPEAYNAIGDNFQHANFLLHTDTPTDGKTKQELFSKGYIYHQGLALASEFLTKYDVILGNPPWEKIRFEKNKLAEHTIPDNFAFHLESAKDELKKNSFFKLSNVGELNTYALFTDAAVKLKHSCGVAGLILKSGLVTSQVNQKLFRSLVTSHQIVAIYDFINRRKIFNIDSRERFCFLLLGQSDTGRFRVAMNLTSPENISTDIDTFEFNEKDLRYLNPISGMLPNFSNAVEAQFVLRLAKAYPAFAQIHQVKFGRIVHLNTHAQDITQTPGNDLLPIYEGKFFNQYNGRFAGFNGVSNALRYGNKSSAVPLNGQIPESRFFISKQRWLELSKNHRQPFMLAWRSLTSASNTRTCIATILPFIPAIQSVQFLTSEQENLLYLCALFNSVVFDFILKKKLSGIDLTQSVINQMPVPYKDINPVTLGLIDRLVIELLKDDERLVLLFAEKNKENVPNDRHGIIREIDLIFMKLYKLTVPEVLLVLSEFTKQYDETDIAWFVENLTNDPVSSPGAMASACPVG